MRFQVPQFTDVEDKIVGSFTFKQFLYVAGGAGACLILYSFLPLWLAIIFMLPIGIVSVALAFVKINNKPFIAMAEAFFKYMLSSRLYIWKHQPKTIEKSVEDKSIGTQDNIPNLSNSKLKELNWDLDVKKEKE